MDQWQEEDNAVAEQPQPVPVQDELISVDQFCISASRSYSGVLVSLFHTLELEENHHMGTYAEFQQRFEDFVRRPL